MVAPPDAVCFSVMMLSSNIASSKMTVGVLRSAPALTVLGIICPDATSPLQHPIEGATADSNPRFNSKIFHHGFSFPLFAMLGVDGESSEWCCVRRSFESEAIRVPALCGIRQVCRFVLLFQGGEAISKGQNSKSATGLYSFHWRLTSAQQCTVHSFHPPLMPYLAFRSAQRLRLKPSKNCVARICATLTDSNDYSCHLPPDSWPEGEKKKKGNKQSREEKKSEQETVFPLPPRGFLVDAEIKMWKHPSQGCSFTY